MRHTWRVAASIIGTVIGAGFATGQEIMHFFSRYGMVGYATIAACTVLIGSSCAHMMSRAYDARLSSYIALNDLLFGKSIGRVCSIVLSICLFSFSVVMLAGSGSVFHAQWGIAPPIAIVLIGVLTYAVIRNGLRGITTVHAFVVPLMIATIFVVCLLPNPHTAPPTTTSSDALAPWFAMTVYVALNVTTAQALLVPLAASGVQRHTLVRGSWIGALFLGILLIVIHHALMHTDIDNAVPMATIARTHGPMFAAVYALLTVAEIVTTLITNVYGLMSLAHRHSPRVQHAVLIGTITLCMYCAIALGFVRLLQFVYPIIGVMGIIWLVRLLFWRAPRGTPHPTHAQHGPQSTRPVPAPCPHAQSAVDTRDHG
jgi:uncharacterized membrane protein YkvI